MQLVGRMKRDKACVMTHERAYCDQCLVLVLQYSDREEECSVLHRVKSRYYSNVWVTYVDMITDQSYYFIASTGCGAVIS